MTCWLPKQYYDYDTQNVDKLVSYSVIIEHAEVNNILFSKLFQCFNYFLLKKPDVIIPQQGMV